MNYLYIYLCCGYVPKNKIMRILAFIFSVLLFASCEKSIPIEASFEVYVDNFFEFESSGTLNSIQTLSSGNMKISFVGDDMNLQVTYNSSETQPPLGWMNSLGNCAFQNSNLSIKESDELFEGTLTTDYFCDTQGLVRIEFVNYELD